MKSSIKKIVDYAVKNKFLWKVLNSTILPIARYAEFAKAEQDKATVDFEAVARSISPDLTVKHGPFCGMQYPPSKAFRQNWCPNRLLGSYEQEIAPALGKIFTKDYTEIINIGCGEGYYAVGLAMRIGTANIFAYDVNKNAIQCCKKMAQINHVSERIQTGYFCSRAVLESIPLTKKALIFSDCEGYEKELFTKESASRFREHDLLIEVHDFVDIEISSYLRSLFAETHEVESYQSVDDIKKAQNYSYPELESFSLAERKAILTEARPAIMEWLYFTARAPHPA